jgi:alpha-L-fucosidase
VRANSPQTVVFSDIGPDMRWVPKEQGFASETNWALLDTAGFKRGEGAPLNDTLESGNYSGKHFMPAEVDVSIRKG